MKILILKPSSLGDVVQSLPVLRLLKQHRPTSEIYWWLGSEYLPLLEHDPDLAGVVAFKRRSWQSPWKWPEALGSIRQTRVKHFDWVIDLQGLARSGLFAWLADGAFTIGVDDPREGARAFYDLAVPRPSAQTHAVDWYLEVLRQLQVPVHWNFTWLPVFEEAATSINRRWPVHDAAWVLLNPGARWSNKRWPLQYFVRLVGALSKAKPELRFAVLGGAADAHLGQTIAAGAPHRCVDLTGRTSLPEMVEWIRRAVLMITNDTGPMHVAAALGTPLIALFGPTDPRRTGPYGQINRVVRIELPCAPCLKSHCYFTRPLECLQAIHPEAVLQEALRNLECLSVVP